MTIGFVVAIQRGVKLLLQIIMGFQNLLIAAQIAEIYLLNAKARMVFSGDVVNFRTVKQPTLT